MTDDKLLACLVKLTQIVGRPTSEGALTSGLPLTEKHLTPELLPRAAVRAGLQANLKKLQLKNIPVHFPIPVILLLQNQDACLLTDITDHDTVKIINPFKKQEEIPFAELKNLYTGHAFVIEHDFHFSSQSEHRSTEDVDKNWFWDSIRKLWMSYGEMLVASFLINIFALAVPLFTMNVYDRVVPNQSFQTLWVLATGIFIVFAFDILMRVLRSYFIDQAGKMVDLQVSANILERIIGIKMTARTGSVGSFANTVQSFDSVREFITSTTVTILVDLPFSVLFIFIISLIGGSLAWIPIFLLPLAIIVGLILQRPLVELTQIAHRYASEKQSILFETLSGIETIKTNCAENIMQQKWEQATNLAAQIGMKLRSIVNFGMFFSIFIQQLSTVLVIILGVYKISHNELTVGALVACSILSSRALAPMAQIAAILTRYHQTVTSLNSLNDIMRLPVERPSGHAFLQLPVLKGDIEFRDVTFQYPKQITPILKKITFKIKPGEHVGIIGRVGSGKTTIAKMILGLLQPTLGSIFFDGIDQTHFDLTELRQRIGYVPQDVTLFFGTLRENITFGVPHVEDSKIIRAIEVAGIDEFITPKLGSYQAEIKEGGKNLSGGQRQIIAIARAVLLDAPMLVLDEPTNSMDSQTENIIKAKLIAYLQNKTFILMTHRPSLLDLVSRVIVIDGGKIIIDGSKDAVLKALAEGKITVPKA